MQDDKQKVVEETIEKLDDVTDIHSLKISILENTTQEHTNQLNQLLS